MRPWAGSLVTEGTKGIEGWIPVVVRPKRLEFTVWAVGYVYIYNSHLRSPSTKFLHPYEPPVSLWGLNNGATRSAAPFLSRQGFRKRSMGCLSIRTPGYRMYVYTYVDMYVCRHVYICGCSFNLSSSVEGVSALELQHNQSISPKPCWSPRLKVT